MQNGRYRKMKWDNVILGMLLIPVIDVLMCLDINMILFLKYLISASYAIPKLKIKTKLQTLYLIFYWLKV